MLRIVCAVISICFLFGCNQQAPIKPAEIVQHHLVLEHEREDFGEYGVFSGMLGMVYNSGRLYLPDFEGGRVVVADTNLAAMFEFARKGQGPGELNVAGQATFSQGRFFVNGQGSGTISTFDPEGNFLERIPLSKVSMYTRYAVFDEMLFASSPREEQPISVMDFHGNHLYKMGTSLFPDDFARKKTRNHKHLFVTELDDIPTLVAVSMSEPTIELFSLEGELLLTHDLSKHPALEVRQMQAAEVYKDPTKKNTSVQIFPDAAVSGNQLLCAVYSNHDPHAILRFSLSRDKIVFRDLLRINAPLWIRSMAYDGVDHVFIFDGKTNSVRVYKTPPLIANE